MFKFSRSSLNRLRQCEPDLMRVAEKAILYTPYDFGVSEGLRTLERQKELLADGKSTTLKSRHLPNENGLSEAMDIMVYVNGKVTWEHKYYRKVIQAFIRAAIEEGVQLEFGGLWESFLDSPHIQLSNN